jgi:hypothetical protein
MMILYTNIKHRDAKQQTVELGDGWMVSLQLMMMIAL